MFIGGGGMPGVVFTMGGIPGAELIGGGWDGGFPVLGYPGCVGYLLLKADIGFG
jgi:hypothetical protein